MAFENDVETRLPTENIISPKLIINGAKTSRTKIIFTIPYDAFVFIVDFAIPPNTPTIMHIANAKNVPLEGIDNISYDKSTIIILYCASGMRSMKAAEKLSKMGYTNLYNLDGGLLNWGFDLE